ncbi:glycosyltransferase involved in cell wall biosynthesis [Hydrogenophaga palleronii]|uniref:Glycosyltransferase involved in cell wall biosynthesis n=1 Tax=Hydrogenophaga palleronii TaxID=65655 RepID=A0ABU1WNQ2_9BURK|nr:glycosyltransferase [Hydrogenophaga palleronii]MDR7150631.1 glycosyltransferase involved in cell wall biosynthesis [Hydrogenophaga palleronii]
MTYVFWHSYLMFHQAAYIRALAEVPGNTVRWCVTEDLPAYYRERGYPVPDTGKVLVHIAPTPERTEELARLPGSVQVFFGLRGFALPLTAFKASLGAPVHRFLMTENRYEPGAQLLPRWLVYTWDALRYRRHLSGVFCIGHSGRYGGARFFSACGYPAERIVPFVHVVDSLPVQHRPVQRDHKEILYVGQLIVRKRVDLLLQAFSQLDLPTARLRIIGKGDQEQHLLELAHQLDIAERVDFSPGMPNADIVAAMAAADVLVLPSRFDGWGAVVNEALMVGTPVISSDRCGASDVIENGRNGYVFEAGNARALLECLESFFRDFHWDRAALASAEASRLGGPEVAARFQLHALRLLAPDPVASRSTAPMEGVAHRGQQP